jgi:hypothetical protein
MSAAPVHRSRPAAAPVDFANTLSLGVRVNWLVDENLDDNRDDDYSLNYGNYRPKSLFSCLVTAPARSWQCGDQGSSLVGSTIHRTWGTFVVGRGAMRFSRSLAEIWNLSTVMAGAAVKDSRSCDRARLLFVVYGREATRVNGNHEWLTSNVIGWWTNKYGICWQHRERWGVNPLVSGHVCQHGRRTLFVATAGLGCTRGACLRTNVLSVSEIAPKTCVATNASERC